MPSKIHQTYIIGQISNSRKIALRPSKVHQTPNWSNRQFHEKLHSGQQNTSEQSDQIGNFTKNCTQIHQTIVAETTSDFTKNCTQANMNPSDQFGRSYRQFHETLHAGQQNPSDQSGQTGNFTKKSHAGQQNPSDQSGQTGNFTKIALRPT